MDRAAMERRVGELLLERRRLAKFDLSLPPDLRLLLSRLLQRLGMTRVPMSRRASVTRYSERVPTHEPVVHQTEYGPIHVSAESETSTSGLPAYTIWARRPSGERVGSGTLDFINYGGVNVANLHPHVEEEWRRMGVGSAMYKLARTVAAHHGHELVPTGGETDAAAGVWKKGFARPRRYSERQDEDSFH